MTTRPVLPGIHHITAVASSAAENLAFYQDTLGLRLVKKTVNFDDPYTYHLYFGDAHGSPGTILTFFPWERLPRGNPGAGMVTAVAFAITPQAVDFWKQRLASLDIETQFSKRFGQPVIHFSDPHGLALELIGSDTAAAPEQWPQCSVPEENRLRGFHSATATVKRLEPGHRLLVDVMGMASLENEENRFRYKMAGGGAGNLLDVLVDPEAPKGLPGGGTVHHIAFRTAGDREQRQWQSVLRQSGFGVTDVRDRHYFRSIYYHTPDGILFEIATDPPGFARDETFGELGSALKLPEQYEPLRADIVQRLTPLEHDQHVHIYQQPPASMDGGRTLVALHGTGGSESDLIPLAARIDKTSAILSVRGNVLENGKPRFFRRYDDFVFDEKDIARRVGALSRFLKKAAAGYARRPDSLTALGYSNGANMAAAALLLEPDLFAAAILLRPMLPLKQPPARDLGGRPILILRGSRDAIIPSDSTDRLIDLLAKNGARVSVSRLDAGHGITDQDIDEIERWMQANQSHASGIDRHAQTAG